LRKEKRPWFCVSRQYRSRYSDGYRAKEIEEASRMPKIKLEKNCGFASHYRSQYSDGYHAKEVNEASRMP